MTRKPSKARPDPYRRDPPTIDLPATEVSTASGSSSDDVMSSPTAQGAVNDRTDPGFGETAIEPIAATGLDGGAVASVESATVATEVEPAERRPGDEASIPLGETVNSGLVEPEADTGRIVAAAAPPDPVQAAEPVVASDLVGEPIRGSEGASSSGRTVPSFASRTETDRFATSASSVQDAPLHAPPKAEPEAVRPEALPPAGAAPSRSGGRAMPAGLIGGLVGAGLATAGSMWLANSSDLAGRVSTLESRPAAASVAGDALAMVERRVVALETADRTFAERLGRAESSAEANTRRLAELAGRPAAPAQTTPAPAAPVPAAPTPAAAPSTPAPPAPVPVASQPAPAPRVEVAEAPAFRELAGRVTAVESAVQQARQNGEALSQLQSRLTQLDGEARQRNEVATRGVGDLGTRLAALERTTTEGLRGATTALEAGQARVTDLDQRAAALSGELAKLNPQAIRAGLRLVVATRLGDQLRTGAPFGPSLATLERLDAPAPTVAALRPFASALPPTTGTLLQDFAPLKTRILDEARPPADTVGERLLRMADKVVTVRAVGDGSGSDLPGLVGRIETSLSRGDAVAAATAWDALPASARDVSSEWGARLKARVAVEGAVRQIATDALAALDGSAR